MDRVAVCSWSLRPEGPNGLARTVAACGLGHVQLALDPIRDGRWDLSATRAALDAAGIAAISGMMATAGEDYSTLASIRETGGLRPSRHWDANLHAARANAALARSLGLPLVTFHAGFIPHDRSDPERGVMLDRVARVAEAFAGEGVAVALETGQEDAATLLEFLHDLGREDVGVNFDPANMILYGMGDPVAAIRLLAPLVRQIHVKDAVPSARPGEWGQERPVGDGSVAWEAFFREVAALPAPVDLVIEREGGDDRAADVMRARDLLARVRRSPGGRAGPGGRTP